MNKCSLCGKKQQPAGIWSPEEGSRSWYWVWGQRILSHRDRFEKCSAYYCKNSYVIVHTRIAVLLFKLGVVPRAL